jgi:choline/glycine/proline betaine transport protein
MGVPATVTGGGAIGSDELPWAELATDLEADGFVYRVLVRRSPVPTYGGRMIGNRDQYARLEVHLADGGQDYDVMGYTTEQVIHDCLDQYERHLEFLRAT